MSYQRVTGSLMANTHSGSYCGQDAYNDMFIVENYGLLHRERTVPTTKGINQGRGIELYARSASNIEGGMR